MANPFSNRKKIRGWKRRLRQLASLRDFNLELDPLALSRDGVRVVKLLQSPWSNLVPRNPPIWYRREVLRVFGEIYDSWSGTLAEMNEPFYLKVWLFHPRFHRTQVVAAVGDRVEWYESGFTEDSHVPPEPLPMYQVDNGVSSRWTWTPCLDQDFLVERKAELDREELEWLTANATEVTEREGGELMFRLHHGSVWLGSR